MFNYIRSIFNKSNHSPIESMLFGLADEGLIPRVQSEQQLTDSILSKLNANQDRDIANMQNALQEILILQQKFDALCKYMGIEVAVAATENGAVVKDKKNPSAYRA
jgi:hypothetical protein